MRTHYYISILILMFSVFGLWNHPAGGERGCFLSQSAMDVVSYANEMTQECTELSVAFGGTLEKMLGDVPSLERPIHTVLDGANSMRPAVIRRGGIAQPTMYPEGTLRVAALTSPFHVPHAYELFAFQISQEEETEVVELTPLDPDESLLDSSDEALLPPLDDVPEDAEAPANSKADGKKKVDNDKPKEEEGTEKASSDDKPAETGQSETEYDLSPFSKLERTLVLDPGHGGEDTGATAGNGMQEKDMTLAIALKIKEILAEKTSLTVRLTRDEDEELSLSSLKAIAAKNESAFFLSLHGGFSATPRSRGITLFSDQVAQVEEESASAAVKGDQENRRQYAEQAGVYVTRLTQALKENSVMGNVIARACPLVLQREINAPVVLMEIAYLSNIDAATLLSENEYQEQVALNIAWAIASTLNQD